MRKLTPFLVCLLVVFVGALFALNFLGLTEPVLYYAQFESQELNNSIDNTDIINPDVQETTGNPDDNAGLPSYYNCVDSGKINKTRDQGDLGSCWAFAVNAALESRLLPDEKWDFSEDHMLHNNGFSKDGYEGGDYFMAVAYLAAWKGPVPEEQDPYNDGETNLNATTVKHLQEARFITNCDTETIKEMVYKYGAVESAIHMAVDDGMYIDETYYDRYNYSYCYDGDAEANHEIVIIGWDDDYSMTNFKQGAYKDGAFICLNSWGNEFGDYGIFYVSYCDTVIGQSVEVYTVLEGTDNYDHNYQYDEHGWVGRMGFEEPGAFFANVFTADGNENLEAVSFYATGDDTSYSVYVCRNYENTDDLLSGRTLYAQGDVPYMGYYTVKLDEAATLDAGERFAVIVEIETPGSLHPVAIEMEDGNGRTDNVSTEGKESYISANGRAWSNTQTELGCNVCLKAFTSNR